MNEEYYFDSSERFCNICNNLCLININQTTFELEYICRTCDTTRIIIYCPYSHKLCIKKEYGYVCPDIITCKCASDTSCYTNKLQLSNSYSNTTNKFKFSPNIKYDNTYFRTKKIKCTCTKDPEPNPEHIIYMINPKTIDKAYICTKCNAVQLSIIKE